MRKNRALKEERSYFICRIILVNISLHETRELVAAAANTWGQLRTYQVLVHTTLPPHPP